ncbi:MAG: type IV pilus assembly protein PilM [Desulfobulbaceae bacterium]|nr:type IV pilus assembly protein PilM [Desulfobulbaceae bacterium]MCK5403769.1 type IV pilus assembly protein PilM [Desulfobulbaceae bacterium]
MGLKLPEFKFQFNLPFLKKQKLSLGIDIGSYAVKVCEMTDTSKGRSLLSLGSSLMPEGAVEDGVLQDPAAVARVISNLSKNIKVKGTKTAISISGYSVIVKKINLEVMSDEDMESHIHTEAEQYIPFDIEDVYLDFQNLHTNKEGEDRTDVMLVAAKKDVVDSYLGMLKTAGLSAVVVDVDAFALENAYEDNFGLTENIILIDIGASKMNINIISKGTSILARDVVLGSRQITEQIQARFDLSYEEAEALKIGNIPPEDRQEELEDIFSGACTQWIAEIKRALDFYSSNHPDETISRMVISGGGARIKGLDQLFSEEIGIPAEIFNPFSAAIVDNNKIDPEYLKYIAPEMAISMGLSTRPAEI